MDRRRFLGDAAKAGVVSSLPIAGPPRVAPPELPTQIVDFTASQLSGAIRLGQVSCVEVMEAYLAHIHRYNPVYNAIVSMADDDELIAEARRADEALAKGEYRGWMHGMPHAVKDLADAVGFPTSQGSPIYAGTMPSADSQHIARIRAQGAIFIGKTNVPEFGMGSQSYNPIFGATGSACDPALTAGGSSGGAASGLGTHMLPVADGGDLMGSLRNPGAFNNVIGFRPTPGRVPGSGSGDLFYQELSVNGPMGRNVEDTTRLLDTMAGWSSREPLSLRDDVPSFDVFRAPNLREVRIGWLGDYDGHLPMEPGILELCESGLESLASAGAAVEPCLPVYDMDRLWQTWLTLRHWSRHGSMRLYDDPRTRRMLKPEAVWEIEGALDATGADIYRAGVARADWFRALEALFERYDFLALPTAQVFPFPKEVHWPETVDGVRMDTYHRWMEVVIGGTLGGLPVVNVPVGFDARGRPMGMQLMGPFGEDQKVLELAMAYERVTDYLDRRPELRAGE
jgi:amidase